MLVSAPWRSQQWHYLEAIGIPSLTILLSVGMAWNHIFKTKKQILSGYVNSKAWHSMQSYSNRYLGRTSKNNILMWKKSQSHEVSKSDYHTYQRGSYIGFVTKYQEEQDTLPDLTRSNFLGHPTPWAWGCQSSLQEVSELIRTNYPTDRVKRRLLHIFLVNRSS